MEASNKIFWEQTLDRIEEPPPEKRIFSENARMDVVMIEFRPHPWLKKVLWNAAHVYGGRGDVGMCVVCGKDNFEFVQSIVGEWPGVYVKCMSYGNINIPTYNKILTNASFYDFFRSPYILLIQTDTLTLQAIPDKYYNYSYCGAPWIGPFIRTPPEGIVGNGGYSFRNVAVMKQVCTEFTHEGQAEDLFFAKHCKVGCAPLADAHAFSVEHLPHPDPCGLHQAWRFHHRSMLDHWFLKLPGLPCALHPRVESI